MARGPTTGDLDSRLPTKTSSSRALPNRMVEESQRRAAAPARPRADAGRVALAHVAASNHVALAVGPALMASNAFVLHHQFFQLGFLQFSEAQAAADG
ncbi:MAG TPA: hypothetical protein VJV79_22610 [Polyangiaceae bacterium]|nr:hypothetical protein [Polyangiaceae bacterium]